MRDKEVISVVIPQDRYRELLEREEKLRSIIDKNRVYFGYKYLDLRSHLSVMEINKDDISLDIGVGEDVPESLKKLIIKAEERLTKRLEDINERRFEKIEGVRAHFLRELEFREKHKLKPTFSFNLREFLGLNKHPDEPNQ